MSPRPDLSLPFPSPSNRRSGSVSAADLRGTVQLATDATLGTARLVEAVHARILSTVLPGSPRMRRRAGGLTGWIYRTVRQVARFSGLGTATVLRTIEQVTDASQAPDTGTRRPLLSIVNGVLGDHLAASANPLARPFTLRTADGSPIGDRPARSGPLIVFVHGLCLDDRSWTPTPESAGHVGPLTDATDGTPVFARYNTGRSVAVNGRELSSHLERATSGPNGPSRVVLVTHSMGGLVARHALDGGRQVSASWPGLVTDVVYLGTPHQGAPLEQTGAWIEARLRRNRFTAPFADLARVRSRGIQDLRHGLSHDGRSQTETACPTAPPATASAGSAGSRPGMPPSRRCLYVAAARAPAGPVPRVIGDGLVPVSSALHLNDKSPSASRRVVESIGHLDLLQNAAVTRLLVEWMTDPV